MKTVDLHLHTTVSDGSLTPAELVNLCYEAGLSAIAITDHDCIGGCEEALSEAEKLAKNGKNIRVIPGVEISSGYCGRDIHILGLFIDTKNEALCKALELTEQRRDNRNLQMVKNFNNAGIPMTIEELTYGNPDTIITRGHFCRYLIEKGYAKDRTEAFKKYLDSDGPFFVEREYIDFHEATRLIINAGGIPILAHPLLYKYDKNKIDLLVSNFKNDGGMGIEAIYSSNENDDEEYVRSLARKYDLVISGGTDFHGACKPDLKVGVGRGNMAIPYSVLEGIESLIYNNK